MKDGKWVHEAHRQIDYLGITYGISAMGMGSVVSSDHAGNFHGYGAQVVAATGMKACVSPKKPIVAHLYPLCPPRMEA
jgi:hypothetical protein